MSSSAGIDQLTGNSLKQLQVISIAGMAGIGKTTLARKLYRDPLIEYVFDIQAWTCVSQVYVKRDLLLGILSSFFNDPKCCEIDHITLDSTRINRDGTRVET